MNRLAIAILLGLAVPTLSGCIGYPPDAVHFGDAVAIRYDAFDLTSGQKVLVGVVETVHVGSGASSLGLDGERALVGHRINDSLRIEVRHEPGSVVPSEVVTVPVPPIPDEPPQVFPRPVVEPLSGPPSVGHQFTTPDGNSWEILAFDEGNVTIRPVPRVQDYPQWGVRVISEARGFNLTFRVEPLVGATFNLTDPFPPLQLQPGFYRVLPMSGDQMQFAMSLAPGRYPSIGQDLAYEVTIVSTPEHGDADLPPGAGSPQLSRDPRHVGLQSSPATANP